jgi:DNA-binding LacI/PurR family transcriptional regulator
MTRATIRDVAKKAGVGVGTVSRVLNNNPSVSVETRERVLSVISELDFTPNPIARQLSTGRTLTIGVILPHLTMPSYVERLRGVQNALAASEYDLVLFSVETPEQRDAYFDNLSRTSRVDGVIIISIPPNDEQAQRFADSLIPTVLVDAYHSQLNSVVTDDFKGGRKATRYLIELGHKKIAFLGDYLETPFQPSMRYRFNGYKQALVDEGIPFRSDYHVEVENERSQSCEMAKKLLQLEDPPTAIFGGCDIQAIGIIDGASEVGVRIPEDLSVIGYDGIRDSEYLGLTTIQQHLFKSGVEGVNMLLGKLSQKSHEPRTKFIPFDLIQRDTTSPPRFEP